MLEKVRGRDEKESGWREGGYGRLESVCCVSSGPLDTPSQSMTATISPLIVLNAARAGKGRTLPYLDRRTRNEKWIARRKGQLNEQL